MNINHSNNIMLFFVWFVIIAYLCDICDASRRIFDTTMISKNRNTFDCLIAPISAAQLMTYMYGEALPTNFEEISQYCRRSTLSNSHNISMKNVTETNYTAFTFDELRSMNVTSEQLYEWYAPTDVIEGYIAGEKTGSFVNCSNTMWFGSKCEYTLDSPETLLDIIRNQFRAKKYVPTNLSLYTNGTCYEMNNTDCESIICLDWREICDGKNLL